MGLTPFRNRRWQPASSTVKWGLTPFSSILDGQFDEAAPSQVQLDTLRTLILG